MTDSLVLDSSCWIAWLDADDTRAAAVDRAVDPYGGRLLVPAIVAFEIDRWLRRNAVPHVQRRAIVGRLGREQVIPIDLQVALRAGTLARAHGLATADALIAGAASVAGCSLATFDPDFADVPGAVVLAA